MSEKVTRRSALKGLGALGAAGLTLSGPSARAANKPVVGLDSRYGINDLDLSTPEARSSIITKVMGSIGTEDTHAFMRFHIYGYLGDRSLVPLFSMNNYLVQKWKLIEPGTSELRHYEVGYYCEFDTDNPITHWTNPVTGKTVELEQFVLGPIGRMYTPQGIIAPGIAPNPLRVNVVGNRVFVPAQSLETFPNMFTPEEFPELSSGPTIFWDSMYTFSANIEDVLNPELTSAPAEIHMQNMTSWQPFFGFGNLPGRSMVRSWGCNISGFDALEPQVRAGFEKYTPDIFETDTWNDVRFDSMDYYNKVKAERAAKAGES
ncbi:DUF1838 family protein [Parahaliea maris]|nr:DUF1838 family protein [Parahaliea maris]